MIRLTREVRFAINPGDESPFRESPTNGFAGYPTLLGLANYLSLDVTLEGDLDKTSSYLCNIRDIDQAVRKLAIPIAAAYVERGRLRGGGVMLQGIFEQLRESWLPARLHHLRLSLSPFTTLSLFAPEFPMVRLSQKFEFSASHRLHNPALSDAQNRDLFGKCNNPHGHGHNYVLQVTVAGNPDANGVVMDIVSFEKIVAENAVDPLDHRNLNEEIPEFSDLNPTVENIAMVIYRKLKPRFDATNVRLAGVTLWETSKTWCEYME
jgi:6-pyruvoyltetrahydropterin/6-carboxytetrahydropterin synthase